MATIDVGVRRSAPRGRLLAPVVAALGLAALGVVMVATAPPAAACSCAGFTDEQARGAADVVFVGEVREVRLPGSGYSAAMSTVWFDVSSVVEGEAYAEQPVQTEQSSASCGLEVSQLDGPVLVFAERVDRGETVDEQRLRASGCGGTRRAPDGALPVGWDATAPRPGTGATESGTSRAPWLVAGAVAVAVAAGGVALTLRHRHRRA